MFVLSIQRKKPQLRDFYPIKILAGEYSTFDTLGCPQFLLKIPKIVMGPKRPTNINTMMTHLEAELSTGVMPNDKPTVPNAEIASNINSVKGLVMAGLLYSIIDKMMNPVNNKLMAIPANVNAFNRVSSSIFFCLIMVGFPLKKFIVEKIMV